MKIERETQVALQILVDTSEIRSLSSCLKHTLVIYIKFQKSVGLQQFWDAYSAYSAE